MEKGKAAEFDEIAQTVFLPMYSVIAEQILQRTGVFEGRMVDIGCGGGHLGLNVLRRSELSGTFVDISSEAVEICQDRAEEWGLSKRVRALAGDVHALPLENESAELIVSRSSYGFWDDYDKAFTEIYRVLAPGGEDLHRRGAGQPRDKKTGDQGHGAGDARLAPVCFEKPEKLGNRAIYRTV